MVNSSGKSSFINALLGKKLLKEGITPTTSKIGTLRYGDPPRVVNGSNFYLGKLKLIEGPENETLYVPVEWLKEISLVDTPGTNAVVKGHQQVDVVEPNSLLPLDYRTFCSQK